MKVTTTEFQQNVGRYQDAALSEPVTVTKHGRDHVVILKADDYERLKRREREVLLAGEVSDQDLLDILRAKMPPGREHLDNELG